MLQSSKPNESYQKIRQKFIRKGYNSGSFITKIQYQRILNQLMPAGHIFNEQVAQQVWDQAISQATVVKKSNVDLNIEGKANLQSCKDLRVSLICETIVDAQSVLKNKINEVSDKIQQIQTYKRRNHAISPRTSSQMEKQLNELYQYKQSYQQDYNQLTEPFGLKAPAQKIQLSPQKQSEQLKILLYLTLSYTFMEIILVFGKPDFLNLIVVAFLLSLFLLNFFDQVYIRFSIVLIAISVVLDIVWLIIFAKHKWNPQKVANQSQFMIGYWRFVVFFTVVIVPLKGVIIFYLLKFRNSQKDQRFTVSLGIMKLMLSQNKSNPITKQLENKDILKFLLL